MALKYSEIEPSSHLVHILYGYPSQAVLYTVEIVYKAIKLKFPIPLINGQRPRKVCSHLVRTLGIHSNARRISTTCPGNPSPQDKAHVSSITPAFILI